MPSSGPSIRLQVIRLASVVAALAGVVLINLTGSAGACACVIGGPVVAKGESPSGMGWQVQADRNLRHDAVFTFTYDRPGYSDAGWGTILPRPLPRSFVVHALVGGDLNPAGEGDVGGIAGRRVNSLVLELSDGTMREFAPKKARPHAVRKFKWLRSFRFFDVFFADGVSPIRLTAYDDTGRSLGVTPFG